MNNVYDGNISASVVMPTYNKKERLELTLESFNYQTADRHQFEVIVIDDGSTDGTEEMIKSFRWNFNLRYCYQRNSGRSHSRNAGVRLSNCDLIIFCDDDLLAPCNFVKSHVSAHMKDPLKIVHGMIYNLPYLKFVKNPITGELYPTENSSEPVLGFIKNFLLMKEDLRDFVKVDRQKKLTLFEKQLQTIFRNGYEQLQWLGLTGGNSSCMRQQLEEVGLFDEYLGKQWGCEDFELGYRLHLKGCKFCYLYEAFNYHLTHFRKTYIEELRNSVRMFYSMHKDPYVFSLEKLLFGEIKKMDEYVDFVERQGMIHEF